MQCVYCIFCIDMNEHNEMDLLHTFVSVGAASFERAKLCRMMYEQTVINL